MSFESRLRKESPHWVAAGVVTADQARQIEAMHPENDGATGRRFLGIITMLGGTLCVVGLALIISANWEHVHRWIKLTGFMTLMMSAYCLGVWLKEGPRQMPRTGEALLMIGCAMFISGIALVSQIYHIDGRPGDGVLVWIAAIAAVPLLTKARGPFLVLLMAIYSWVIIEAVARDGRLALLAGVYSREELVLPFMLLCASLLLYWLASLWPATWRGFATMQQAWALGIICITVYVAGFMHHSWHGYERVMLLEPALLMLALVALAAAIAAWRDFTAWRHLSVWLLLAAVPAVIALGGFLGGEARIACAWLSSAALLVLNVFMARAGLQLGKPWMVNLGIAFIALNIFTRYFDFFATMLDQGMMFFVSGVVVLSVGWLLERKRRALLGEIRRGGAA